MSHNKRSNNKTTGRRVVVSRHYKSNVERAFHAWTKPELLHQWFGPPGTQATVLLHELKVGGQWKIRMNDEDGNEFHHFGSFLEISEPNQLVFTWASEEQINGWRDADGKPTVVTIDISQSGDGIDVQITHENIISDQAFNALTFGWSGSLVRLQSFIQSN